MEILRLLPYALLTTAALATAGIILVEAPNHRASHGQTALLMAITIPLGFAFGLFALTYQQPVERTPDIVLTIRILFTTSGFFWLTAIIHWTARKLANHFPKQSTSTPRKSQ